jgi:ABC-type multidrug transport system fused ATPase/permease subunit
MTLYSLPIDPGSEVDCDNLPPRPVYEAARTSARMSTVKAPSPSVSDELGVSKHSTSGSGSTSDSKKAALPSASFRQLFQFAETKDLILFGLGIFFCVAASATMPAINIVFGDVVNAIAQPVNVAALVDKSVRAMTLLGVYGFVTFFLSFWLCGTAAANIANGWRMKYLEHLLIQDMQFFDTAQPGSLTLMLSDDAMAIQTGLAEKFALGVQGFFQFIFGFAIAFWFGPILALVLLACVPVLALITTAMFMWGSEDGMFGKEAYESAATIANEVMSNIRTIASLNAEPIMSERYDSKLGDSEKAAIRQGSRNALLTGLLFGVIFVMYGLGFWFGATMIADSIDENMAKYPPPEDLSEWYDIGVVACPQYVDGYNDGTDPVPFEVCVCGLPWDAIDGSDGPNCGCGYQGLNSVGDGADEFGASVLQGCVSGGQVMMVFFSILIGGFSVGQIGPGVQAVADAKIAAAKLLKVIERVPTIGGEEEQEEQEKKAMAHHTGAKKAGSDPGDPHGHKKPKIRLQADQVKGEIVLENMHFRYTRAKDVRFTDITAKKTDDKNKDKNEDSTVPDDDMQEATSRGIVFGGCNLTIKAGQTVALVGESGCG